MTTGVGYYNGKENKTTETTMARKTEDFNPKEEWGKDMKFGGYLEFADGHLEIILASPYVDGDEVYFVDAKPEDYESYKGYQEIANTPEGESIPMGGILMNAILNHGD